MIPGLSLELQLTSNPPSSAARACMLILMPLKSWKHGTIDAFRQCFDSFSISNTGKGPANSCWSEVIHMVKQTCPTADHAKRPRFSSCWSLPTSAALARSRRPQWQFSCEPVDRMGVSLNFQTNSPWRLQVPWNLWEIHQTPRIPKGSLHHGVANWAVHITAAVRAPAPEQSFLVFDNPWYYQVGWAISGIIVG